MFDSDPKSQLERLEMLCNELMDVDGIPKPKTELEVLAFLENALRRSRGRYGWQQRLENFLWRCMAPFQDMRIHKQIRLHSDLLQRLGREHPTTLDSLAHLDDLIFERTYGRAVEGPVKRMVRLWISREQLNRRDAVVLVKNNCLATDDRGNVTIKNNELLWLLGVLNLLIAFLGSALLLAMLLFSGAPLLWTVVGVTLICTPLAAAWWVFLRYTLHPRRVIPRAERLLSMLKPVT